MRNPSSKSVLFTHADLSRQFLPRKARSATYSMTGGSRWAQKALLRPASACSLSELSDLFLAVNSLVKIRPFHARRPFPPTVSASRLLEHHTQGQTHEGILLHDVVISFERRSYYSSHLHLGRDCQFHNSGWNFQSSLDDDDVLRLIAYNNFHFRP